MKSETPAHTALPWKTLTGTYHDGQARKIVGPHTDSSYVLSSGERREANAELICRAVNSHAALVVALRLCLYAHTDDTLGADIYEQARAALKLATEGSR